jgi:O-antigen/teichoic acid export membrane protein
MLKRLFKETLIYGLSRYLTKFIGVILLPLYTAVLTPEDYGILDLLSTIALVSGFLIVSGTDAALSYYFFRKEYHEERSVMISTGLWMRLLFSLVVLTIILFGADFISELIFGKDLSLFVIITGVTILFTSVYSFLMDLLRFELRSWLYTFASTFAVLLNILFTIYYVLILGEGVYGALIASAAGYGIVFAATCIYVFKRYGFGFSAKWLKRILIYGFPLISTGIAVWVLGSTDRYFLAHFSGVDANGIYAVGMKIAMFIGLVVGTIQLAWGPFAMDIQYEKNAKQIYAKVFLLFSIISVIAVFFVSMFAIDFLKVFTQPDYYSARDVIPFLSLSTVFSSAYFVVVLGIHLTKKLQHTIWITITAAILNIALNYFLTPVYGPVGAAISIMCANFVIVALTLRLSQKYYYIKYRYSSILFIFVPSSLIIAVSYYFELSLSLRIIFFAVFLAGASFYLLKEFRNSEEIKKLLEMVKLKKGDKIKSSEP